MLLLGIAIRPALMVLGLVLGYLAFAAGGGTAEPPVGGCGDLRGRHADGLAGELGGVSRDLHAHRLGVGEYGVSGD